MEPDSRDASPSRPRGQVVPKFVNRMGCIESKGEGAEKHQRLLQPGHIVRIAVKLQVRAAHRWLFFIGGIVGRHRRRARAKSPRCRPPPVTEFKGKDVPPVTYHGFALSRRSTVAIFCSSLSIASGSPLSSSNGFNSERTRFRSSFPCCRISTRSTSPQSRSRPANAL